ncbi:MAG: hypothetical protein HY553_08685 [Elusimicrobia bacterium]|nr:hypothetical protein [Elusimicrobiota bacterium]
MIRLVLAVLLLAAACSKKPEPEPPAPDDAPAAAVGAPDASNPEPPADTTAPFAGAERVQGLLVRMQGEGAPYGVEFELDDLRRKFQDAVKDWDSLNPHQAKDAGIAEPELREFDDEDKAKRGPRFKWYDGGAAKYADRLPADGEGVVEAWGRVYGSSAYSAGPVLIMQSGIAADRWRRLHWQPTKRRWSHFTESDERAGRMTLIEKRLVPKAGPERKEALVRQLDRLARQLREARGKGSSAEPERRDIKNAIAYAYEPEIELEAARWAAEQ